MKIERPTLNVEFGKRQNTAPGSPKRVNGDSLQNVPLGKTCLPSLFPTPKHKTFISPVQSADFLDVRSGNLPD